MAGQPEHKVTFPPFVVRFIEERIFERNRQEDRLDALRDALLWLLCRAGMSPNEDERARIQACTEPETLFRWLENILWARSAAAVLSHS
jgi:hypothetical protein